MLGFQLTGAQQRAIADIDRDVARSIPMQRLLQGDVGSGKTAVAVHALLRAVEHGGQGALMAPTETLATQHLGGIAALCEPLGVRVTHMVNAMPAAERRAALGVIESGEPQIVVGTHALIQDAVVFGGLELVVVDEQHRFGVEQRQTLAAKAEDERRQPPRAAHDRHADPAHAGADRLRRPRRLHPRRAAARTDAGRSPA